MFYCLLNNTYNTIKWSLLFSRKIENQYYKNVIYDENIYYDPSIIVKVVSWQKGSIYTHSTKIMFDLGIRRRTINYRWTLTSFYRDRMKDFRCFSSCSIKQIINNLWTILIWVILMLFYFWEIRKEFYTQKFWSSVTLLT